MSQGQAPKRAVENTLLEEVAARIVRIDLESCPPEARETAKLAILDTVGVTLAGTLAEGSVLLLDALKRTFAPGPALLFGNSRHADILSAALFNGTASHALDYDDCSNTLGGHPSAPVVSALWPLAQERHASGAAFLAAYIAGFETETRLARVVNLHHYEKGWHPTATLGIFGATAACCHLLGLDARRTAVALALATSMASGIKANFGTMTKPFHVGHCARNALEAALLAEAGMTASLDALEHPQGFLQVYNGAGNFTVERLLEGWADPLDIVETGVAFKRHPCCASTHSAVDAMLQLRQEHGLSPKDVASVRSWTHPRRLNHTNRPDPRDGLDGKFSVQYVLARALEHGFIGLDHFRDEAVHDPAIREIMSRITAEPHPKSMETTDHFFAEMRVVTVDGRELTAYVDRALGRDSDHPLPEGVLETKFADCAGQILDEGTVRELSRRLLALEHEADIDALSALLETRVALSARAV